MELRRKELCATHEYKVASESYRSFLQQKAKGAWLKDGDANTKMFHRSIKQRELQIAIFGIHTVAGECVSHPEEVNATFLDFYQQLLGTSIEGRRHVKRSILNEGPLITHQQGESLLAPLTGEEIKQAIWSIHGDITWF